MKQSWHTLADITAGLRYVSVMAICLLLIVANAHHHSDFAIIYRSLHQLINHLDPYQSLTLPSVGDNAYGTHLNPPFFLFLCQFIGYIDYSAASMLWVCLSIGGLVASYYMTVTILSAKPPSPMYGLSLLSLLLLSFPSLIALTVGQITGLLSLLLIGGYYALRRGYTRMAILLWSMASACKLFPGLLIFYLIKQKHYKLAMHFVGLTLLLSLLPILQYGPSLYWTYCQAISDITWYSHSWNSSITGFIFKLLLTRQKSEAFFNQLRVVSALISLVMIILYLYLLYRSIPKKMDQHFSLTLSFMLILSPLGWMYYFPFLFFPIMYCYQRIQQQAPIKQYLFTLCVLGLTMPLSAEFVPRDESPLITLLLTQSLPFYGILLLIYLLAAPKCIRKQQTTMPNIVLTVSLSLSYLYTFSCFMTFLIRHL